MSRFNQWFSRGRSGRKVEVESAESIRTAADNLTATIPDAIHESSWDSLKRDGKFNIKPGPNMEQQILLLVMGAPGVGKKSLIKRLLYGDMLGGEKLDLSMLMMEDEVPRYYCDGFIYSLNVILITNYEASPYTLLSSYDHFGLILAYDVDSRPSLDFVAQLHEKISHSCEPAGIPIPTTMLGLKSDLREGNEHGAQISSEQAEKLARSCGCHFNECSSKTGHAVYASFGHFVKEAHLRQVEMPATSVVGPNNRASGIEGFINAFDRGLPLHKK